MTERRSCDTDRMTGVGLILSAALRASKTYLTVSTTPSRAWLLDNGPSGLRIPNGSENSTASNQSLLTVPFSFI
jgi:hypothetical protein